jgi:hypothetical protein
MPLDWLPKWSEEGQKTINIGVLFSLSFLGWQIAELYRRGESKAHSSLYSKIPKGGLVMLTDFEKAEARKGENVLTKDEDGIISVEWKKDDKL